MLTRRRFAQLAALSSAAAALPGRAHALAAQARQPAPDFTLEIAPYLLEASTKHRIQTLAYNAQVPGPVLRMRQGRPVTVEVRNRSTEPDVVHWHGLFLPPEIDGAMEEGTPPILPGASARYTFTPNPAGFRWFHTHVPAENNLRKAQYGGEHGFLLIEPTSPLKNAPTFDQEICLALHDWEGRELGSDDGSMMPVYEVSTINGKMLGFAEPLRVKQGQHVLLHILNSSPTEVHWVAFAGHSFHVVALDGNPVPVPRTVPMLRLAPAERVSAVVEMNAPGVWVLGEVRKHIQAAGMGMVVEYTNATGSPKWQQPEELIWDYAHFAYQPDAPGESTAIYADPVPATEIPLAFDSRFEGHGREEQWRINGKAYPETESPILHAGQRYRLVMKNLGSDDHPVHLHRHLFEVTRLGDGPAMRGLIKDVVLIPAKSTSTIEFTAAHPGNTLFHCHQQNHMDRGFMMLFRYA